MVFNLHRDLSFYCIIFFIQIVPFKLEKLKIINRREKKIWLKAGTKPVTRWCKLWPWKQRFEKRFESISFKIAWFFHKIYIKLFHTLDTFYLPSFPLNTLASSNLKMYREPMKGRAWLMPVQASMTRVIDASTGISGVSLAHHIL